MIEDMSYQDEHYADKVSPVLELKNPRIRLIYATI